MQTRYHVTGMTCHHCVTHVTTEVSAIPAVEKVEVHLDGTMTVESSEAIEMSTIQEAVAEAGDYTVAIR